MPNFKVYGHVAVFQKWAVFFRTRAFIQRGQSCGMCIWALIKSAHVPVQHPGHISNACSALFCSALLLEYEICMGHKEHMDHPSQYPLQKTIKKIIKPNTHMLPRTQKTYTPNGAQTCTPTSCIMVYQFQHQLFADGAHAITGKSTHARTRSRANAFGRGEGFDTDSCTFFPSNSERWCKDITKSRNITTGEKCLHKGKHEQMPRLSRRHKQARIHMRVPPR